MQTQISTQDADADIDVETGADTGIDAGAGADIDIDVDADADIDAGTDTGKDTDADEASADNGSQGCFKTYITKRMLFILYYINSPTSIPILLCTLALVVVQRVTPTPYQ